MKTVTQGVLIYIAENDISSNNFKAAQIKMNMVFTCLSLLMH